MITLEEAWNDFASENQLDASTSAHRALEIAFHMGAAFAYQYFLDARKTANPGAEIRRLFEEIDFFMMSLPYDSPNDCGHA